MVIKVCGMKEAENIRAVSQADIQWMGFIFYPKSARYYTAPSIDLPERIKRIGVFVNASLEEMLRKKEHFRLDYLQLHGEESPELCREAQASGAGIIKAIPIAKKEDLLRTERYTDCVDYFLFDTETVRRNFDFYEPMTVHESSLSPHIHAILAARIGEVELTAQAWEHASEHREGFIDAFRIHGEVRHRIRLEMGLLAYNLLCEEYPLAERDVRPAGRGRWVLDTEVASMAGVGRFVVGLLDDIRIVDSPELTEYIRAYIAENLK